MSNNKLYVGNLSFGTTQEQLKAAFSQYGDLGNVKLVTDFHTGESRGFAFLTFREEAAAKAAAENNSMALDGRTLKISIAIDKPQRQS